MAELAELLTGPASALDRSNLASRPGLCARCVGRLLAKVGVGYSNVQRGTEACALIGLQLGSEAGCPHCRGTFTRLDRYVALCRGAMEPWGFRTFLIGSRFDPATTGAEEELWTEAKATQQETIKGEFNRELGKLVAAATGKEPEFEHPDLTLVVDTQYDTVDVQVAPLFVRGRYRKLVRGIPQTRWPCRECRGTGCARCGGTGKMYQTSVEEIVAKGVMVQSGGSEHFFHGMGREDVDALMLGDGRPFVLEVRAPRRRDIDLAEAERAVNAAGAGVEVSGLSPSDGREVVRMKEARGDKSYEVSIRFAIPVAEAKLNEVVVALRGREIVQRTPSRVAHRRADRHRRRVVKDAVVVRLDGREAVLRITAETGTYIKELVHGDSGRTRPSIAELLGTDCAVDSLEVVDAGKEG